MPLLITSRLQLIPASTAHLEAALEGPATLGASLGVIVPANWPPVYLDPPAFRYVLNRIQQDPAESEWWMYLLILAQGAEAPVLVGTAGYKGPPDPSGTVEVGYGIVSDWQRRGLATEAVGGLLRHAFADASIHRVIAHTLPELTASIGVLGKCGFVLLDTATEPGAICFGLSREAYEQMARED